MRTLTAEERCSKTLPPQDCEEEAPTSVERYYENMLEKGLLRPSDRWLVAQSVAALDAKFGEEVGR